MKCHNKYKHTHTHKNKIIIITIIILNDFHYPFVLVLLTQVVTQSSDLNTQEVLFGDFELRLIVMKNLDQTAC